MPNPKMVQLGKRIQTEKRSSPKKKVQLIDLGEWAGEEKVISSPAQESDINNLDPEDIEAMLSEQHSDFFKH